MNNLTNKEITVSEIIAVLQTYNGDAPVSVVIRNSDMEAICPVTSVGKIVNYFDGQKQFMDTQRFKWNVYQGVSICCEGQGLSIDFIDNKA